MCKKYAYIVSFLLFAFSVLALPQPTHWYKFDGDATDSAGSLDLTEVNGVSFEPNDKMQGSRSAFFDGNDDYFQTNDFSVDYENITIATWIKPSEGEILYIFGQQGQDPSNSYDLQLSVYVTDEFWLQIHNGADQDTRAALPSEFRGDWIHLTAVIANGKVASFYIDGQPVQTYNDRDVTTFNAWTPMARIGARANPDTLVPFSGFMDDYRVWLDRAITDEDVHKVYMQAFEENMPPTIEAPEDIVIECNSPQGASDAFLGEPQVSDDKDPEDILVENDAPSTFPIGDTEVTWTASDSSNAQSSDTQQVTVIDSYAPSIAASLVPINLTTNKGTFKVNFGAKDVCDQTPSLTATVNRKPVQNGDILTFFKRAPPSKLTCSDSNALIVFSEDSSDNKGIRVIYPDFS